MKVGIGVMEGSQNNRILLALAKAETKTNPVLKLQANSQVHRIIIFSLQTAAAEIGQADASFGKRSYGAKPGGISSYT